MSNNTILFEFLAQAVVRKAVSRCPEVIKSRDQGESRRLAFVIATTAKIDEAIARLRGLADSLGHVDIQEDISKFKAAIEEEAKTLADAGLAAFNNFPQHL